MSLRVLFMGTPPFAATVLRHLLDRGVQIVGVVAQPSKPSGRGLTVQDPPTVELAKSRGIPDWQPAKLVGAEPLAKLAEFAPDLIVTAAYGKILRAAVLGTPRLGCWNVHGSLLPRHRGAAPVTASLLAGDAWTGITIFQMDEGMDTGPMLRQEMLAIEPNATAESLTLALAELGGRLLGELLADFERNPATVPALPQPSTGITYTRLVQKEDGRILWNRPADQLDRWVRAVTPWPGAFGFLRGQRVRIHRARPLHLLESSAPAGTCLRQERGLGVVCRPGLLLLEDLQLEGKKRLPAAEWLRGFALRDGERFEVS